MIKHLGITTLSEGIDGSPFWYVIEKDGSLISGRVTGDIDDLGEGHCITGTSVEEWHSEFNDVILPVSYKNACLMMRRYLQIKGGEDEKIVWKTDSLFGEISFTLKPFINKLDKKLRN